MKEHQHQPYNRAHTTDLSDVNDDTIYSRTNALNVSLFLIIIYLLMLTLEIDNDSDYIRSLIYKSLLSSSLIAVVFVNYNNQSATRLKDAIFTIFQFNKRDNIPSSHSSNVNVDKLNLTEEKKVQDLVR